MRYDLTDFEWSVIKPILPRSKPGPRRKDDRRVLNGIFWVLRADAPWLYPTDTALIRQATIASDVGQGRRETLGQRFERATDCPSSQFSGHLSS